MELGNQIKKYRSELNISQDVLAEKIFVSRQTISNWENNKSYPDVNSLLRLSEIFNVSIDILIKGDLEEMKEQIKAEDKKHFQKLSEVYTILFIMVILTPIPLIHFLGYIGVALWVILFAVALYFAIQVEKEKKKYNIQTYKEIVAFTEGKGLDEIEKAKEEGKRPYQKIMMAVAAGIIALVITILIGLIFNKFF